MTALRILRAGASDVGTVAPLFDSYRVFYGRESDAQSALDFLRDRFEHSESVIFYAATADAAAGFVQLYPLFSSVALRRLYVLNDLYVMPAYRRAGIARALLSRVADFARAAGACSIVLQTGSDNAAAQALYRSAGYDEERTFRSFHLIL